MPELVRIAPTSNNVLLATAYMTWAAGLLGLHDVPAADRMLAKATQIDPDSSSAFGLWAEAKRLASDGAAADKLDRTAREASSKLENYSEVAALYFQLAWRDNQPVT